jgi:hypothetical protein
MNIADMQREIGKLQSLITALRKMPDSLNEEIFQKYLEFESTPKVATYLRDKGIRTQSNRSFKPGDISEIIRAGHTGIDPALVQAVQEIFKKNTRAVARAYW